jgi:hypothetical protein
MWFGWRNATCDGEDWEWEVATKRLAAVELRGIGGHNGVCTSQACPTAGLLKRLTTA